MTRSSKASSGKAALVTGGAQGIGRAVVERLLADEFSVALMDSDLAAGRAAEALFRNRGDVLVFHADVSKEADVRRAIDLVKKRWGRLDLLVNNAGLSEFRPLADETLEHWNKVIGVNLTGPFILSKHAAPLLSEAEGGGVIVNISSTRSQMSEPGTEAYSASKGGLAALTHALALSLGPKVRVNCISPGWIDVSAGRKPSDVPPPRPEDHEQHPVGRVGRPEDVANMVAWLAGPEASFLTGADLTIDGGMSRKMIYVP